MARRFKFKPPPGVIVGTLLIWSPAIWLAREAAQLRAEVPAADASPEVEAIVEGHEVVASWSRPYHRLIFRASGAQYFQPASSVPGTSFRDGERAWLRIWQGKLVSARDEQGRGLQFADHPALRTRDFELTLLTLGLVGMAILVVGALVGGATDL